MNGDFDVSGCKLALDILDGVMTFKSLQCSPIAYDMHTNHHHAASLIE